MMHTLTLIVLTIVIIAIIGGDYEVRKAKNVRKRRGEPKELP